MQSLDYKLKTSNTSYVTARHDVQYFPSSLSSFSPATSRVCRIPLAPATPNPACFIQRIQVFANGQRCDDINYYGRTVAAHDLLKRQGAQPEQGDGGLRRGERRPPSGPRSAPGRVRGRSRPTNHGGDSALWQDAAAATQSRA